MKVDCTELYPYYDIDPIVGVETEIPDDMLQWVQKTMAEFKRLQEFLAPRYDRAYAKKCRLGQLNAIRKAAKGSDLEVETNAMVDREIEKIRGEP